MLTCTPHSYQLAKKKEANQVPRRTNTENGIVPSLPI